MSVNVLAQLETQPGFIAKLIPMPNFCTRDLSESLAIYFREKHQSMEFFEGSQQ
jgi:hypothetical protein